MKKIVIVLGLLVVFVILAAGLLGWRALNVSQMPPKIKVVNDSGVPLHEFTLEGTGFEEGLGTLPPRSNRTVVVHPQGESGLRVSFRVDSEYHEEGDLAYIESKGDITSW